MAFISCPFSRTLRDTRCRLGIDDTQPAASRTEMTNIELGDVSQQIYEPGNLVLGDSASLVRIACKRVADSSLVIEVPDDPAHAMRPGRAQMSESRFHRHCIRNKVPRLGEDHPFGTECTH